MDPNHTFPSSFPSPLSSTSSPSPSVTQFVSSTQSGATSEKSIVSNPISVYMGAFILGLVFLLGVPGNLFIIWSILSRARKRSVTTLLILNLACADGFLMTLTVFFVVYLAKQSWVFGNGMCKALFYLCNANMYASILLITLMSLHRLVVVVKPRGMSALAGRRTVLRLLVALWVLVLLMSLPALVFREAKEVIKNRTSHWECKANHTLSQHRLSAVHHTIECVSPCRLNQLWLSSRVVTSALAFISSCVNPLLYTLAGKAYMRQEGVAFMARLFEGLALEPGTRRGRKASQGKTTLRLQDRDTESSTSTALSPTLNTAPATSPTPTNSTLKNG
ncbi:hypothetical protein JZ751_027172, partial [Albula glossodonta]